VFKELAPIADAVDKSTSANNAHANVFMPEKKRRKRDGYDDGDYTLHKTIAATDFIHKADAVGLLGTANAITFSSVEEKDWLKNPLTSSEIKASCTDLKVLGKGDFKALMKWRAALREEVCFYHSIIYRFERVCCRSASMSRPSIQKSSQKRSK
jgi:AdoMet-dependent rRNA methyltransferase SPB1